MLEKEIEEANIGMDQRRGSTANANEGEARTEALID